MLNNKINTDTRHSALSRLRMVERGQASKLAKPEWRMEGTEKMNETKLEGIIKIYMNKGGKAKEINRDEAKFIFYFSFYLLKYNFSTRHKDRNPTGA